MSDTTVVVQSPSTYTVEVTQSGADSITVTDASVVNQVSINENIRTVPREAVSALVNTDKTASLKANGNIFFTNGSKLSFGEGSGGDIDIVGANGGWAELQSSDANSYIWVDNTGAYIGTGWNTGSKQWSFTPGGSLVFPDGTFQNTAYSGIDPTIYTQANTAYNQSNVAYVQANTAYDRGNTAYNLANTAYIQANISYTQGNTAYSQANVAHDQANIAYTQGNTAYTQANTAYTQANTAYTQANGAYVAANTSAQTIPQVAKSANYTLTQSDAGKFIYYTQSSSVNLYIPPSNVVAFPNGATIMIISKTTLGANVTVTPNSGVSLFLAGNSTSVSRNVGSYGMATLMHIEANTWFINGTSLT